MTFRVRFSVHTHNNGELESMTLGDWLAVGNTSPGCYLINLGDLKFRATQFIGGEAWTIRSDLKGEVGDLEVQSSPRPTLDEHWAQRAFGWLRRALRPGLDAKDDVSDTSEAPSNRMDWSIATTHSGEFDELVLGNWLHVEKMDHGFYFIRLGEQRFFARWADKAWSVRRKGQ